jgi:hypothetical protein
LGDAHYAQVWMLVGIVCLLCSVSRELQRDRWRNLILVLRGHLFRTVVLVSLEIYSYFKIVVEVPNCGGFLDCGSCAQKEACAWCASENTCVTISEAFSKDCGGLVFDLPCPDSYVSGMFSTHLHL